MTTLSDFKEGQEVVLVHKTKQMATHGTIHSVFDAELGRLEVLEPFDNSIIMVTPDDKFWNIEARTDTWNF